MNTSTFDFESRKNQAAERLATQWGARYPKVIESWKRNWRD
ncbi:MAG: hypothetical protein OKBPIBMD_01177 [Chlorobi bacterium]|nr:hypothetical protein [Chlorobiota bacterium]MCL4276658.1 transposase [Ignavibacteria bacterium]WKZ77546.1 MAG: hypothetical protein QY319_10460 [Candidatus Kapabacteria bacterium]